MGRRILFKIALVFAATLAYWLFFRERVPELVVPITADEIAAMEDRADSLTNRVYERYDVPLWRDRDYHTSQFVQRLGGREWASVGRNEEDSYVIEVQERTSLITIANRKDLRGVEDWTALSDPVFVDDSYPPRRFDVMLSLDVEPGTYRVRSPKGGPSKPVFWDPRVARLMP